MALSKLAVKRLTKLADYMEKLPKSANKHFHMGTWFNHNSEEHDHKFGENITLRDLHKCGTTACALGWACMIPAFHKAGLRLLASDNVSWVGHINAFDFFEPTPSDRLLEVAANLFGGADKTPKQWAKRCRQFIRENSTDAKS